MEAIKIKERVTVAVFCENLFEEWTAGSQHELVGLKLFLILTDEGHVKKLFF